MPGISEPTICTSLESVGIYVACCRLGGWASKAIFRGKSSCFAGLGRSGITSVNFYSDMTKNFLTFVIYVMLLHLV